MSCAKASFFLFHSVYSLQPDITLIFLSPTFYFISNNNSERIPSHFLKHKAAHNLFRTYDVPTCFIPGMLNKSLPFAHQFHYIWMYCNYLFLDSYTNFILLSGSTFVYYFHLFFSSHDLSTYLTVEYESTQLHFLNRLHRMLSNIIYEFRIILCNVQNFCLLKSSLLITIMFILNLYFFRDAMAFSISAGFHVHIITYKKQTYWSILTMEYI